MYLLHISVYAVSSVLTRDDVCHLRAVTFDASGNSLIRGTSPLRELIVNRRATFYTARDEGIDSPNFERDSITFLKNILLLNSHRNSRKIFQ